MTLCISLKINTNEILPLVDSLGDYIKSKGIEDYKPYKSDYDFHASIGYVKQDDTDTLEKLIDFADYIKKELPLPHFKPEGLSVFKGIDGKHYLVLNLSEESPYIQIGKELAARFDCTVPHPHISLGYTEASGSDIPENVLKDFKLPNNSFKTVKIQVWDKSYKVVKEAGMKQKKASLVKQGSMTTAEILALEHDTYQNSTPAYSIPTEDIDIKKDADTKKIASLISTLTEQVQYNRPDTLSKIAIIVSKLETFLGN